jgi:hypothetical protein
MAPKSEASLFFSLSTGPHERAGRVAAIVWPMKSVRVESHSSAAEHGQRSPRLMRPPKRDWVTSERYHDAIAGQQKGVGSSHRKRGVEEEATWEIAITRRRGQKDKRAEVEAYNPNYRRGKWKANQRLDPHDRHNNRVRRVMSPHHIRSCSCAAPECDPRGTCLVVKGPKAPRSKEDTG